MVFGLRQGLEVWRFCGERRSLDAPPGWPLGDITQLTSADGFGCLSVSWRTKAQRAAEWPPGNRQAGSGKRSRRVDHRKSCTREAPSQTGSWLVVEDLFGGRISSFDDCRCNAQAALVVVNAHLLAGGWTLVAGRRIISIGPSGVFRQRKAADGYALDAGEEAALEADQGSS